MLSGLDLNDVTDLNGAIERGIRNLIQRAKIPEGTGRQQITLYDRVYDYASPSGLFASEIADLRPQGMSRSPWDFAIKKPESDFDRTKKWLTNGYRLTTEYNQGTQILRIANAKATAAIMLDDMSVTTGWTASGNASSLAQDKTVYYEEPSALRFSLAASGSLGILTKTISPQDLTAYQGVGVGFLAIRMPSATAINSVTLRLGSSSANYYSVTSTTGFVYSFMGNYWFLVPFDLSTASTTGTPVITAMNYLQLRFAYSGIAVTNFYVGGLFIALPSPHELLYQTAYIFQNSTGTIGGSITDDNDTLLLNDATYNIALHEAANEIELQQSGGRATSLNQKFERDMYDPVNGLYTLYRVDNPSQSLRGVGNYLDD